MRHGEKVITMQPAIGAGHGSVFEGEDLSLQERDVLRCFWRARHAQRSPHIRDLAAATGSRHTGNLPGIVVSLIRKGYLRDLLQADSPALPARVTGARHHA